MVGGRLIDWIGERGKLFHWGCNIPPFGLPGENAAGERV
jgi:hypothetical protein